MQAILMNKNTPTIEIELDETTGRLVEISKELNPEFLPVIINLSPTPKLAFDEWLRHRSISETRPELQNLLENYGVSTTSALSLKNLGLNLSDQYWFKPLNSDLKWEDVNFFLNDFAFSINKNFSKLSTKTYSPNASSNGELYKFWIIKDNKRYLYKDSSRPYHQQAYNEVIASRLLDILNIPHVEYSLEKHNNKLYSACETFIDTSTEYVPALYILNAVKKEPGDSAFRHFMRCTKVLDIPHINQSIETMLAFDAIINNEDRHFGNFGFIRNVETLKFTRMAPVFDNGNSLWYMSALREIERTYGNDDAKPFKKHHAEQVKLISNNKCIDFSKINSSEVINTISNVLKENPYIEAERLEAINKAVLCNLRKLELHFKKSMNLER